MKNRQWRVKGVFSSGYRTVYLNVRGDESRNQWWSYQMFRKTEDNHGLSMYQATNPREGLDWDHLAWGTDERPGHADNAGALPDNVFKEIFHLLYTIPHPGVYHEYDSIVYDSPS